MYSEKTKEIIAALGYGVLVYFVAMFAALFVVGWLLPADLIDGFIGLVGLIAGLWVVWKKWPKASNTH